MTDQGLLLLRKEKEETEEWIVQQIVTNNRKRLRELIPDMYMSIEKGKRITDLPIDVLAHCLSFIHIGDVRSCWSTCKLFARAITTRPHFWKRLVQAHLKRVAIGWMHNDVSTAALKVIHLFDTFASPRSETLKEQCCFLFKSHLRAYVDMYFADGKKHVCINRQNGNARVLCRAFEISSMEIESVSSYESPIGLFNEDFGEYCGEFYDVSKYILIYQKGKAIRGENMKFSNGFTWDGEVAKRENGNIAAHGSGKWTFPNGTVLEGQNVADMGKPVFKLSFKEMQEYKRLKSEQK